MKSYSSREVIQMLLADGWYEVNCVGDHHRFKHPTKHGKVTVTHPRKDIPLPTLQSISKQSGLKATPHKDRASRFAARLLANFPSFLHKISS